MKKILLYGLPILVLLFLILGLLAPKTSVVERSELIEQPITSVFDFFVHFKNMQLYSSWQEKDPNTKHQYLGEDATVGFVHKWKSNHEQVGVGQQKIVLIEKNKKIETALQFFEPFESSSSGYFLFEAEGASTRVTWGYKGEFGFIESLIMWMMDLDKDIGDEFSKGLQKAKLILEN